MKASKFSEAQIAFVLKQAEDGTPIGEVCRKAGISEATFYNWRKRYAGLMPSEMKRLRQLGHVDRYQHGISGAIKVFGHGLSRSRVLSRQLHFRDPRPAMATRTARCAR